jgi:hypothetical protein
MTYQGKFATLFAVLLATACAALLPTRAHATCDATLIEAAYGSRDNIFFAPRQTNVSEYTASFVPGAFVGRIVFASSTGTFTWSQQGNSGGVPMGATFTGTYSVNSDCTGTMTRNDGVEIFFTIVQGGEEIDFAFLTSQNGSRVAQGVMKKQSVATCDATLIEAAYGSRDSIFFAPRQTHVSEYTASFVPGAFVGRIVFTPNPPVDSVPAQDGTFTWSQQGNSGGVPMETTFTGTYSVNSDCTGTMTRNDGVEIFFTIVQGGEEIDFAFLTSQNGSTVGQGVMKKQ